MKIPPLVLAGSLAANAALGFVCFNRSTSATAPKSVTDTGPALSNSVGSDRSKPGTSNSKSPGNGELPPAVWSTLEASDLKTLAAKLRAAGFPPSVIRSVIQSRLIQSVLPRYQEMAAAVGPKPFWATGRNQSTSSDPKFRAALNDIGREYTAILKDALGPEGDQAEETNDSNRRQYGDLPREKIEQLQKIVSDYSDLTNQVKISANGITLPEDQEKLDLLERERRADLAKILSPQELEEFLVRSSPTTARLRTALTAMNATEEEFRVIYRAQLTFDEKYYNAGLTRVNDRQADQARVAEEIKNALGDARLADYTRASDSEFQILSQVAQQAQLPTSAAIQVYDLRTNVANESNRIFSDANLSTDQKRAALQTLAQAMRSQVTATLGESAARTYLQSATWLNRVEQGSAVTFTLGGVITRGLPVPRPAVAGRPIP